MAIVHHIHQVRVFTTPLELRDIADRMEREFPERGAGDPNHIWSFFGHKGFVEVCFHADQEAFEKQKAGEGRGWS